MCYVWKIVSKFPIYLLHVDDGDWFIDVKTNKDIYKIRNSLKVYFSKHKQNQAQKLRDFH